MTINLRAATKSQLVDAIVSAGYGIIDPQGGSEVNQAAVDVFPETAATGGTTLVDGYATPLFETTGYWLANVVDNGNVLDSHPLRVYPASPDRVIA
jgi:hypothetical protein